MTERSEQGLLFPDATGPSETSLDETFRRRGFAVLAGVDEAGRGPLAGPVVAAAVILPRYVRLEGLDDSKVLSPRKRDLLMALIESEAVSIGIGIVEAAEIDRINILRASEKAMVEAVSRLDPVPDALLIDGPRGVGIKIPQFPIVRGDAKSQSISAASVVAKVTRDRIMIRAHHRFPQYGFLSHKGYGTRMHREAIRRFGCTPIHRRSFRGVKEFL